MSCIHCSRVTMPAVIIASLWVRFWVNYSHSSFLNDFLNTFEYTRAANSSSDLTMFCRNNVLSVGDQLLLICAFSYLSTRMLWLILLNTVVKLMKIALAIYTTSCELDWSGMWVVETCRLFSKCRGSTLFLISSRSQVATKHSISGYLPYVFLNQSGGISLRWGAYVGIFPQWRGRIHLWLNW